MSRLGSAIHLAESFSKNLIVDTGRETCGLCTSHLARWFTTKNTGARNHASVKRESCLSIKIPR